MKGLLVVHAAGLTPEKATRGDLAANLSDLIADGSFASLAEPPDFDALRERMRGDGVAFADLPCSDVAAFDADLGNLRAEAASRGADLAVVSETVWVSQKYFPEIQPGTRLTASDVLRLLTAMRS